MTNLASIGWRVGFVRGKFNIHMFSMLICLHQHLCASIRVIRSTISSKLQLRKSLWFSLAKQRHKRSLINQEWSPIVVYLGRKQGGAVSGIDGIVQKRCRNQYFFTFCSRRECSDPFKALLFAICLLWTLLGSVMAPLYTSSIALLSHFCALELACALALACDVLRMTLAIPGAHFCVAAVSSPNASRPMLCASLHTHWRMAAPLVGESVRPEL